MCRVDFAVMQTIIRAIRGTDEPARPIDLLGAVEADLDPAALAWVNLARAVVSMTSGEVSEGLELAQAAARGTAGFDQFAALALAGRLAAWSGNVEAATAAMAELDAHGAWGRSATAARQTLRAAVGSLRVGKKRADLAAAEREWSAALVGWRDLDLPLHLGLCHLDRWFLAKHRDDQKAAAEIFERLGATALAGLSKAGVTHSRDAAARPLA